MSYITFTGAGKLAALAAMLDRMGHQTNDQAVALGMEAPYLFIRENGCYHVGSSLYQPRWLDLYLRPRGFHLHKETIPSSDVPARLRSLQTAMLPMRSDNGAYHPVVFDQYVNRRYEFINIKSAASPEPDMVSMSSATLRRRLNDETTLYTLESCVPEPVDFIPLLFASLENLSPYIKDMLAARRRTVTREELHLLNKQLFRPLMHDLRPMAAMIGDFTLAEELRLLEHDHRHIFTMNSPSAMPLHERLPKGSIVQCLTWYYEDIVDRLYALGADDDMMSPWLTFHR